MRLSNALGSVTNNDTFTEKAIEFHTYNVLENSSKQEQEECVQVLTVFENYVKTTGSFNLTPDLISYLEILKNKGDEQNIINVYNKAQEISMKHYNSLNRETSDEKNNEENDEEGSSK